MSELVVEPADCADAYRELRERVSELVRSADPAALDTISLATPEWRVRDVLAHMAGVNTDIVTGNLAGVGSDAWTAAQVETRREWPIDDILVEWQTNASEVEANAPILGAAAGQWVYDACTHEHDLRYALDVPGARDSSAVAIGFTWAADRLGATLDSKERPGLSLATQGGTTEAGSGTPRTAVRADQFEIVRAMTGRRSVAQMEAYEWDGAPRATELVLGIFTPRVDDLVE